VDDQWIDLLGIALRIVAVMVADRSWPRRQERVAGGGRHRK